MSSTRAWSRARADRRGEAQQEARDAVLGVKLNLVDLDEVGAPVGEGAVAELKDGLGEQVRARVAPKVAFLHGAVEQGAPEA